MSTKDKQDVENQLRELRRWAKKMGYKIYKEFVDNESGAKGRGERKQFARIFSNFVQDSEFMLIHISKSPCI